MDRGASYPASTFAPGPGGGQNGYGTSSSANGGAHGGTGGYGVGGSANVSLANDDANAPVFPGFGGGAGGAPYNSAHPENLESAVRWW